MFVGVVVENFHRCRAEQEKEERAARAIKRAKKIEERRRSKFLTHFSHGLEGTCCIKSRVQILRWENPAMFF